MKQATKERIATERRAMERMTEVIQDAIAKELGVNRGLLVNHSALIVELDRRVTFLAEQLRMSGMSYLVLGISGGIDSLVAGMMCQKAVNRLNQDSDTERFGFIAMRLPYHQQRDARDVEIALKAIGPDIIESVNIGVSVDAMALQLGDSFTGRKKSPQHQDFVKGNMKARLRMLAQYAIAGSYGGLVVGTDHASEALMGFFTKFGDGACDIAPLAGLTKGQVKAIAEHQRAPREILDKVPTADLESLDEGKPDEEAFGVSYEDIEAFLNGDILSTEIFENIHQAYLATRHKRTLPITP